MVVRIVPMRIDVEVLITLALMLGASAATFWALVRRWESHRQWHALSEWASERKFRTRSAERHGPPRVVVVLAEHSPTMRLFLASDSTFLIQFQTLAQPSPANPLIQSSSPIWNLLIRKLKSTWPPTGLRPTGATSSAVDLFSLSSFPLLGTTERFTVFGTDSAAARTLSESMARSLLPPDIGLLLRENELILDFSDRPFDQIELDRMLALADQLAEKLDCPPTRSAA